jgi:quinohemoprotein ethanol dehydrogenase
MFIPPGLEGEGSSAMKASSIGILVGGLLAYGVMEAQSPGNSAGSQGSAKTAPARAVVGGGGTPGNVTQARVLAEAGRGDNWLVNGGNFESQHFSPLKSITDQNIGRLSLAWALDVVSPMGLSAEPIVVDGVVYLGAPFDKVYAIDGATGKLRWQFDPHIRINGPWRNSYEGRKNRGVAVWNGKVYVGTGDCRMVAIDAASGKQVWATPVCDADQTGITEAPRVGDGKVFTGWAGMEYDVRGGVVAVDAETGKKAWTFWTTPGDPAKPYESKTLEAAAKTWNGESWKLGGANVWTAMTYDAVTNLLLFGTSTTGEAVGDLTGTKSSGSRLFANSIVAVNASTGQYVWHYQTATPPSGAEEFHILLANMVVNAKEQRVVMTVPRNGVFYTLDARTGKAILPPRGIDGTVVPALKQIDLSALPSSSPRVAEANQAGSSEENENISNAPVTSMGHAWFPMGYNAQTGLVYIPAYEILGRGNGRERGNGQAPTQGPTLEADRLAARDNDQRMGNLAQGKLVAFDPIKQEPRWVVTLPLSVNGGVLATAGNLVFHGDASGEISGYAADTGKKVWSVKTASAIQSVPVTYIVNGEQYVLMPIGLGGGFRLFGRVSDMATLESKRGPASLVAFKLGGKGTIPSIPAFIPDVPKPPEQTADPKKIQQGARVYTKFFCHKCHSPEADGSGAWSLDGEVPDLRYMPPGVHQRFNAIVLGGSNQRNGMPKYSTPPGWPWVKTAMTQEEADALHAYLIDLQWKTYTDGPRGLKSAQK